MTMLATRAYASPGRYSAMRLLCVTGSVSRGPGVAAITFTGRDRTASSIRASPPLTPELPRFTYTTGWIAAAASTSGHQSGRGKDGDHGIGPTNLCEVGSGRVGMTSDMSA